jgi:hypothetical protein
MISLSSKSKGWGTQTDGQIHPVIQTDTDGYIDREQSQLISLISFLKISKIG